MKQLHVILKHDDYYAIVFCSSCQKLSSLATECLRPVLGDALVSNVKVAEITDIMVSMSKNDIQVRKTLLGLLGLLGLLFECFGWVYFLVDWYCWGTFFD